MVTKNKPISPKESPVTTADPAEPTTVRIHQNGALDGHNGHYDKYLKDLSGIYADESAYQSELAARGGDTLVYQVEESRAGEGPGALILGTSTVLPGRIGAEYAVTRGHLHAQASRAEVYYCLAGHGVMLLDSLDGESRALELLPGTAVNVPGHWVHRSVNVGSDPLVTVFVYNEDAGQDYALIARAGGMSHLIVATESGWQSVPNPAHRGYLR